jgi:hypothetical protein
MTPPWQLGNDMSNAERTRGGAGADARTTSARRTRYHIATNYERSNLEAAHVILASRERYAGLPVLWAESVLRHKREAAAEWRLVA